MEAFAHIGDIIITIATSNLRTSKYWVDWWPFCTVHTTHSQTLSAQEI